MNNTYQIELAKRTCEGDISAFNELVEMYKKKVYYIAYRIHGDHDDAEDISQEVFIKVFKSIDRFRFDAKLSTWIYQISVNTSIDALRNRKSKQEMMETVHLESLPPGAGAAGPAEQITRDMLLQRIRQSLPDLSKKERMAFTMHYFNEFKLREIGEMLGLSVNTIKTLLLRAKRKLRKKLAQGGAL